MKLGAIIILIFSGFVLFLGGYNTYQSLTHPIKYQEYINTYSQFYNLNKSLVASLINVESSYVSTAKSSKNAIGLMQIKLSTANYLDELNNRIFISENELLNPQKNIAYGCEYLRYLLNKFDDIYTAIAAYNAGETRVISWLNNASFSTDHKTLYKIPYKETKDYVNKIKSNIKFYNKIYL